MDLTTLKMALSEIVGHKTITVLTGAGISAESGIRTFRDNNGLWEDHSIEEVATPEGFEANPSLVYRFYNQRRAQLKDDKINPNPAHFALAKLEQHYADKFTLVTQNVDNLHERAGSQNVLHMHGELLKAKCIQTGMQEDVEACLDASSICTCCRQEGNLRPDIVWFGELPYFMDEIEQTLLSTQIFISIGTSGNVYPAAGFVQLANYANALTIEVNLEPSLTENLFDFHIYGEAGTVLPKLVDLLIE